MHTVLLHALAPGSGPSAPRAQAVFVWVAAGSAEAAEGLALGELARQGWRVLEVADPTEVRARLPGLKRHPEAARAMAAARRRGMAWWVMALPDA